jgi:hypothetical protein
MACTRCEIPYSEQKAIAEKLVAESGGDYEKAVANGRIRWNAKRRETSMAHAEWMHAKYELETGRGSGQVLCAALSAYEKAQKAESDAMVEENALYTWWRREGKRTDEERKQKDPEFLLDAYEKAVMEVVEAKQELKRKLETTRDAWKQGVDAGIDPSALHERQKRAKKTMNVEDDE